MSFTQLCREGRLKEAKAFWITQKDGPSPIDIHAASDQAFRDASWDGHLETAKWLWALSLELDSPIDIHAVSDDAFRAACGDGHLKTAKWLWALSLELDSPINIHALSDEAFRAASDRRYLETAKWLISLGGMPVGPTNPLRRFYLDRFAIIGLLKVSIGRYVRNLRERLYAPGGAGYLKAKERNPLFI